MAFDPALPANSTKLRLAPGVIQDNWVAIQEAQSSFKPYAVNLNNRTPLVVSNDPTAIAETYITYCKDDAAGNAEFFGTNIQGVTTQITQLTRGIPTYAKPGQIFLSGGMLIQWNTESASSGVALTFPTAFSEAAYYVNFIVGSSPPNNRVYQRVVGTPTSTQFTPSLLTSSGSGLTATINWIAIGRVA